MAEVGYGSSIDEYMRYSAQSRLGRGRALTPEQTYAIAKAELDEKYARGLEEEKLAISKEELEMKKDAMAAQERAATIQGAVGTGLAAYSVASSAGAGATAGTTGAAALGSSQGAPAVAGAGAGMGAVIPVVGILGLGAYMIASRESVICTELYRQGLLSEEIYNLDQQYAKSVPRETYIGYRILASPIVRLMQKSRLFTHIVKPLGLAYADEVASRVKPSGFKGNLIGKAILKFGIPLCNFVYKKGGKPQWVISSLI